MNSMTLTETRPATVVLHAYCATLPSLRADGHKWELTLPPGATTAAHIRHLYWTVRREGLDPVAARQAVVLGAITFGSFRTIIPER